MIIRHSKSGTATGYEIYDGASYHVQPFFLSGHAWALADNRFPADGFSKPYQVAISLR